MDLSTGTGHYLLFHGANSGSDILAFSSPNNNHLELKFAGDLENNVITILDFFGEDGVRGKISDGSFDYDGNLETVNQGLGGGNPWADATKDSVYFLGGPAGTGNGDGENNDTFTGLVSETAEVGDDNFIFEGDFGNDTISAAYNNGQDDVTFIGLTKGQITASLSQEDANDLVLTYSEGNSVTLEGFFSTDDGKDNDVSGGQIIFKDSEGNVTATIESDNLSNNVNDLNANVFTDGGG